MRLLFHAHTTYSRDGHLSPTALARLAEERGFAAVFLSDHFEDLDERSFEQLVGECESRRGSCRLVPGYERDWDGFHVIAYGVREWIDEPEPSSWADRVRGKGGLVCLAHSSRYSRGVPEEVRGWCDAVEVWNSKWPYDGLLGPRPKAYELLGNSRFPLAGQDVHKRRDLSSLAVEVEETGSEEELWRSLRAGDYRLASRFLRLREEPGPLLAAGLRLWHPLRRTAWRIAYWTYKKARPRQVKSASG